jgi:3-phenylpropionate/trans-cinnamate dioxygenase ferredoxin subunit
MAWIDVCADGSLAEGEHSLVDIGGGMEVAVFRVQGAYYAIEDVCSHDDGPLADGELVGCQIICPRHGSRFDLRTGEALNLPAYRPIETFPVEIRDGRVLIEA